ncbi:MAG: NUDIX domain-containing protein [Clostridia bacterium]|nr:NUDIX domain-containing protein [Clostridia bacterium]
MKQDISIENEKSKFKYRVSGILLKNDKILTVKINDNKFYCLPGGHVELMENTKDAVVREFKEETGIGTYVEKLLYVTENFFTNKKECHEVGFYYLLNTKNEINQEDYSLIENDNGEKVRLEFKWLDVKKLENFKPEFLKNRLNFENLNLEHLIIKNDKII